MAKSECIEFNGITFRRYPASKNVTHRHYYSPNGTLRKRGVQAYHQELWKSHYGPIPEGYEIHHKDLDPLNNSINNLECLTIPEHKKIHYDVRSLDTPAVKANLNRIRPLTKEWHASPEGIEWHRQHGKEVFEQRNPAEFECADCGKPFLSKSFGSPREDGKRFCSKVCTARTRRRERRQAVEKICEECKKQFTGMPRVKTCSRECGARLRWRTVGRSL